MMADHIQSFLMKNWLCHKKTKLDFHPGVNMIIGPSDHGKSAVMDGLQKVLENRPMGDDFQSWWGGKTVLALKTENHIVKYTKDGQAVYSIKSPTGKTLTFKAFRSSVPQEITDLLRIDRKINVQKQLEKKAPIFLLSENPADIARHFNEVANLGIIDKTLTFAKEDFKADERKMKQIDSQIKVKEKELAKYDKLDVFKKLVIHAEKLEKRIMDDEDHLDRLSSIYEEIQILTDKRKGMQSLLRMKPAVDEAKRLSDQIEQDEEKIDRLKEISQEIKDNQKKLIRIQSGLKVKPLVRRANNLILIVNQQKQDRADLLEKVEEIKETQDELELVRQDLKEKKMTFKKKFPAICPLCNSKVNKDNL